MSRKGPQSWCRDVRLRGGFELRCCLALNYLKVPKRFPNDNQDRNFRCLFNLGFENMKPVL